MKSAERAAFELKSPPPPLNVSFSCPICQKTFTRQFTNDVVLDHDHHTGKIRGWICRMCNNSMGMMEDDVEILKRAINWLDK
jgi:transcription elongation factor Elf1